MRHRAKNPTQLTPHCAQWVLLFASTEHEAYNDSNLKIIYKKGVTMSRTATLARAIASFSVFFLSLSLVTPCYASILHDETRSRPALLASIDEVSTHAKGQSCNQRGVGIDIEKSTIILGARNPSYHDSAGISSPLLLFMLMLFSPGFAAAAGAG